MCKVWVFVNVWKGVDLICLIFEFLNIYDIGSFEFKL